MEILDILKQIPNNAETFQKCKNFYFENHTCKSTNNNIKVQLDYTISCDTTDKIMRFGICNECKTLFYSYDYSSKSF